MALCSVATTTYARERSEEAKDSFKYSHPCPSNGNNHGSCPGYVIDHLTDYLYSGKNPYLVTGSSIDSSNSAYFSGSRGGCFTYTASGNKRYPIFNTYI